MFQKVPWRVLPFTLWKWVEYRTEIRDSQLRDDSSLLHLEANIPDAFRVFALAGCFCTLLCVCTFGTAVLFAILGLAIAARMFALLRGGHKRSFCPNMPSIL
jgi:hypothetical protein